MFDEGLIYRGDYLVNWDPVTQTALADDEVEYEERDSFLGTSAIRLQMTSSSLSIATTRPETMLGDTAVAVSPDDERYQHLIGKTIMLPLDESEHPDYRRSLCRSRLSAPALSKSLLPTIPTTMRWAYGTTCR